MLFFSKIQKAERLSPALRSLYLHKIIHDLGGGLVGMFGVIFFYVISGSLKFTLILFGLICLLYFLTAPLWARLLKYFCQHTLMAFGILFYVASSVILYFLAEAGQIVWFLIIFLIIFSLLNRLFYWVPYNIDFAHFVNKHHRGRQLSFLSIVVSLLGIALPIFSAFVITHFGFSSLFVLSIVVLLLSLLPLYFTPRTREQYSFGYLESFKKLLAKKHFKSNLAYFADGFQDYIGAIIWPIFIFIILRGQYMSIGLISAGIILIGCLLRYLMGEATDRFDKKKLIKTGSLLYALGWTFKALVSSGLHVFLVGVYHDFSAILFRTPFDVLTYEIAADEGHYVDEFTILREMSLNLGRVVAVVSSVILLGFISIPWLFVLSAFISLLALLLAKEEFYLARRH